MARISKCEKRDNFKFIQMIKRNTPGMLGCENSLASNELNLSQVSIYILLHLKNIDSEQSDTQLMQIVLWWYPTRKIESNQWNYMEIEQSGCLCESITHPKASVYDIV